ncbi:MAG: glycoside hydrolase family 15 protein [Elioraea sp.]|nr:glycoside hydrolase family 15 protein [Elioraea sp.]
MRAPTQPLDLGVVGNCQVAALIDPKGRMVWLCLPRLDGDPVFCALLDGPDPATGFMDVLLETCCASRQAYRRNTAILETVLEGSDGSALRVVDFAPRARRFGRNFRPAQLIRRLEPLAGRPRVTIRIRPRAGWSSASPAARRGSNHLRWTEGETTLRVTTDTAVSFIAHEASFVLDRPVSLILGEDEPVPEAPGELAARFEAETHGYWLDWTRSLSIPFEWQEAVIRAAITLKLCTFEETGAIAAALTTSIPEAPGSGRTWDYRYCWLRDSYFCVQALNRLGATRTMEAFLRFLTDIVLIAPDAPLAPLYPLAPGVSTEERIAPALAGFLGDGPVRIGNAAALQVQNDSYGQVILAAAQAFFDARLPRPGDLALFRLLERVGRTAERVALTPDASLWEYRGRMRVHTYSAAMCWAGLSRLAAIADRLGLPEDHALWAAAAQRIRSVVLREAWREDLGSFVDAFGADGTDAALLLLPEIGFIAHQDPRFQGTLARIERRLLRDGLLLRYDQPDDFGLPETAFLVCSFWYVDALAGQGRIEEARALFDRLLALRNHLGLFSEDCDPHTGRLWGNFPQAYSMVGLILSAMRLSRSWEEALWRGS